MPACCKVSGLLKSLTMGSHSYEMSEVVYEKVGKKWRGVFTMKGSPFNPEITMWGDSKEEVEEKIKKFLNNE